MQFIQADLRELDLRRGVRCRTQPQRRRDRLLRVRGSRTVKMFAVVARALRSPGRHLLQIANVLHAEKHMPIKGWIKVPRHLNSSITNGTRERAAGRARLPRSSSARCFKKLELIPFRKRLYSVEELGDIYESLGMTLANVFRGNGHPGKPRNSQY